ncbi:MAG: uracil-DNA glycosylase [Acidimicrobiia bacterium]|nr:uracil-DNA glycosylase [Acidimicrobiia bacterium]
MGPVSTELQELRIEAESCTRCALSETRNKVVFGEGSSHADVMFVGEAPGKDEDLKGKPFVGAAGRLLGELLEEIALGRDEVYIANVLKCRPPGNRDPRPEEIDCCKGYLQQQLEIISPKVVVTLGNFATKLLLRTETGITRMRGRRYEWWRDTILIPTFHPAAALRGSSRLPDMRADFELIRLTLEETTDTSNEEDAPCPTQDPVQDKLFP